jgi:putative membrane protein
MSVVPMLANASPWAFQAHPEVWFLVLAIVGLGWWASHIGTRVLPVGVPVATPFQKRSFGLAVVMLLLSADWPVHDIAEEHLYSVHMLQHMSITMFVPPLFLLATPAWLARLVILEGGVSSKVLRRMSNPVVAGVLFNALVALTHWNGVVRLSAENGAFHYMAHLAIFTSALMMWMPVVSPIREHRLGPPGQMLYLFLMSIIPTIPAGWLTFAEGAVYRVYDDGFEPWGIGVISDQQAAGAIMKVLGGFFLWGVIVVKFARFAASERSDRSQRLYDQDRT